MANHSTQDKGESGSWWYTLPGVLTAIAALLTAITGLIVAFGPFGSDSQSSPSSTAADTTGPRTANGLDQTRTSISTAPLDGVPATPVRYRVRFTSGTKATLEASGGGAGQDRTIVYTILDARAEQHKIDEITLRISVRLTTADVDGVLTADAFRLLIDGVPRAPTEPLFEPVPSRSAGDGFIVFDLPEASRELVLLVGKSDPVELPLTLHKT